VLIATLGGPAAVLLFAAAVAGSAVAATVSRGIRSMDPLPDLVTQP
jgi:hypothetical protein